MAGFRSSRITENLRSFWNKLFTKLPPSTPDIVSAEELVSCLVNDESNQVNRGSWTLKYNRLMPRPNKQTGRLETSVIRTSRLEEEQIWEICRDYFDSVATKPAQGRGQALAAVVLDAGLSFDPDGIPYMEHANIIGWFDDTRKPRDETKNFRMKQAQQLAPHFKYIRRADKAKPSES